jgi:hypothetical protein
VRACAPTAYRVVSRQSVRLVQHCRDKCERLWRQGPVEGCCGVWLGEVMVGGRRMALSGGRALHPPVQHGPRLFGCAAIRASLDNA